MAFSNVFSFENAFSFFSKFYWGLFLGSLTKACIGTGDSHEVSRCQNMMSSTLPMIIDDDQKNVPLNDSMCILWSPLNDIMWILLSTSIAVILQKLQNATKPSYMPFFHFIPTVYIWSISYILSYWHRHLKGEKWLPMLHKQGKNCEWKHDLKVSISEEFKIDVTCFNIAGNHQHQFRQIFLFQPPEMWLILMATIKVRSTEIKYW